MDLRLALALKALLFIDLPPSLTCNKQYVSPLLALAQSLDWLSERGLISNRDVIVLVLLFSVLPKNINN